MIGLRRRSWGGVISCFSVAMIKGQDQGSLWKDLFGLPTPEGESLLTQEQQQEETAAEARGSHLEPRP